MIGLSRYTDTDKESWNDFVANSRNGNFLFDRNYMDYHRERFSDHSLLFRKKNKIVALFPSNERGRTIYSHQGLTFGGLITTYDLRMVEVLEIFDLIKVYYKALDFDTIIYKPIPHPFSSYPSEEELYALFRSGARLISRNISSVLPLKNRLRFSESKRQSVTKCMDQGVVVVENNDFSGFWKLLTDVLSKFDTLPTHSLAEITLLKDRFPDRIRLFEARLPDEEQLLAGIVVYDFTHTVHTQYMANSDEGRKRGVLDYINHVLINDIYPQHSYFSWGISTERGGEYLNAGLIQQKEMMGGRGVVLDTYQLDV